jgi:hypothetical protein
MSQQGVGLGRLSEDWLATIAGLLIVAAIGFGLLGPGAQTVTMEAAPGEPAIAEVLASGGWRVSAQVGGEPADVTGAWTTLSDRARYTYVCADGTLIAQVDAVEADAAAPGKAALRLENNCEAAVSLTLKTAPVLPWPVFGLFK